MAKFSNGDKVQWEWGEGIAQGTVTHVYTQDITKTIKGSEVSRVASEDSPAYLVEQEDGDEVLKSESELQAA